MNQHKELSVLVVDDDPLILKSTAAAIAALGYKSVRTATCATDARSLLFAHRFAVFVFDIYLPDGDGRQLLREALAIQPDARAILISAFMYRGLMIPADLYGKIELLEKPFTADDLAELLSKDAAVQSRPISVR
jgi:DNA-binding NtrC family response regulator